MSMVFSLFSKLQLRCVVVIAGDGGFQMTMNELGTAIQHKARLQPSTHGTALQHKARAHTPSTRSRPTEHVRTL